MTSAIGASEFGIVLLLTILIVVPIAGVAFARSGKALEDLGLTLTAERLGGSDALGMSFDLSRGTMTLTMPRGQELEVL